MEKARAAEFRGRTGHGAGHRGGRWGPPRGAFHGGVRRGSTQCGVRRSERSRRRGGEPRSPRECPADGRVTEGTGPQERAVTRGSRWAPRVGNGPAQWECWWRGRLGTASGAMSPRGQEDDCPTAEWERHAVKRSQPRAKSLCAYISFFIYVPL